MTKIAHGSPSFCRLESVAFQLRGVTPVEILGNNDQLRGTPVFYLRDTYVTTCMVLSLSPALSSTSYKMM